MRSSPCWKMPAACRGDNRKEIKVNKKLSILLVLFALLTLQSNAFAGEDHKAKVTSDNYWERAPWRLVHGAVNLVSSPLHLVTDTIHGAKSSDSNVLYGLGEGIIDTTKFAVLGAWDIVTFWVPGQEGKNMSVTECSIMKLSEECNCKAPAK